MVISPLLAPFDADVSHPIPLNHPAFRPIFAIAASALIVAVLAACSVAEDYEMLGFFFDGVPTPEETAAKEEAERLREALDDSIPMTSEERAALLSQRVGLVKTSKHKPFVEDQCTECHLMSESDGPSQSGWLMDLPELLAPPEELCLSCHERPSAEFTHGPAVAGNCSLCHESHISLFPNLLRNETQEKLCRACHQPEVFLTFEKHKEYEGQDCVECHNPHASEHEFLLKEIPGEEL